MATALDVEVIIFDDELDETLTKEYKADLGEVVSEYIPEKFSGLTKELVYAFDQCMAGISTIKIAGNSSYTFSEVFATSLSEDKIQKKYINVRVRHIMRYT